MWVPRDYQAQLALKGYQILKEHLIVYYAMEERTGKSLTAILTAELCNGVHSIGIITTAKALGHASSRTRKAEGWKELLENYQTPLDIQLVTFGTAHKLNAVDLIIIDEAHKNISAVPKPSTTQKKLRKLCKRLPLIYLSATPHAQGHQQLFHQFQLSTWSPWRKYINFYDWFKDYGVPQTQWVGGRESNIYTKTRTDKIIADTDHLFITKTRKELDFDYEPKDKVHYIALDESTKELYNRLLKDRCYIFTEDHAEISSFKSRGDTFPFLADSPSKLRSALHMIEGGVIKAGPNYITLPNSEKIEFILSEWGDNPSLAIFYNYKEEKNKLESVFKKARVLQATSYAEGVDLTDYDTLVVYSQDTSTARHTQRRARQASKHRDKEIIVHFLLVENAVSEQIYETVSINKQNFVDSRFEEKEL